MSPGKHAVSGIVLGTCFLAASGQAGVAATAAAASVLCDLDHILEYGVYCMKNKEKPDIRQFFSGRYFEKKGTICVVFHAYEYLLALFLFLLAAIKDNWNAKWYLAAVTAGYALHLGLDTIGNDCTFKGYCIGYRARHAWHLQEICTGRNKREERVKD